MADESRTLQLKRFDSLAEAENYAGAKGELTAVYPQGTNLIRTLFLHNGNAGGGVPVSKMIVHNSSIIYVDAVNGDDTLTDGRGWTVDKPFKTLKNACLYAAEFLDIRGTYLTFHLAPGEYDLPGDGLQGSFGVSFVIFDGKNDGGKEVIINTNTTAKSSGYTFQGGLLLCRNIHFRGNEYAVLNSCYNNTTILANCIIENTAIDNGSHALLYAWDDGCFRIDPPVKFIAKSVTGFLAILHATRRGGIQISTTEPHTFTFDVRNTRDTKFLFCTKAGSIVTPAEASFTVSGDVSNIDAVQVSEGGIVSGHGTVYTSIPEQQPTVAAVLGAGTKAVALAAMDETDEVVYEPDIAYMERQRFFAELDEEYRRVGILSKED